LAWLADDGCGMGDVVSKKKDNDVGPLRCTANELAVVLVREAGDIRWVACVGGVLGVREWRPEADHDEKEHGGEPYRASESKRHQKTTKRGVIAGVFMLDAGGLALEATCKFWPIAMVVWPVGEQRGWLRDQSSLDAGSGFADAVFSCLVSMQPYLIFHDASHWGNVSEFTPLPDSSTKDFQ